MPGRIKLYDCRDTNKGFKPGIEESAFPASPPPRYYKEDEEEEKKKNLYSYLYVTRDSYAKKIDDFQEAQGYCLQVG